MATNMEVFLHLLENLTHHKDEGVKRHSTGLLKRLQEINPQDND
jgi:hypothetical protein